MTPGELVERPKDASIPTPTGSSRRSFANKRGAQRLPTDELTRERVELSRGAANPVGSHSGLKERGETTLEQMTAEIRDMLGISDASLVRRHRIRHEARDEFTMSLVVDRTHGPDLRRHDIARSIGP